MTKIISNILNTNLDHKGTKISPEALLKACEEFSNKHNDKIILNHISHKETTICVVDTPKPGSQDFTCQIKGILKGVDEKGTITNFEITSIDIIK